MWLTNLWGIPYVKLDFRSFLIRFQKFNKIAQIKMRKLHTYFFVGKKYV